MEQKTANAHEDKITEAINDSEVKDIYFNGFQIAMGNGDILLVLNRNNKPTYKVNLSYTMAKTLSEKMGMLIAAIESQTGNKIMTTEYIDAKMENKK